MKKRTFYILDVFADGKYAGNQLAVVRERGTLSMPLLITLSLLFFILPGCARKGEHRVLSADNVAIS